MVKPLIIALDTHELDVAAELALSLREVVGGFKVGLELLMAHGPTAIERISQLGLPVFVDAKLHDIPNTVHRAAAQVAEAGARWVTVHASGGMEMVEAANEAMQGKGVLAVTVLTSLEATGLHDVGVEREVDSQVELLTFVASRAGAEGVVCSPLEAPVVKGVDASLVVFTPGVRPGNSSRDDQRRVSTPIEALRSGADYLVVGRPVTKSPDPVAAATDIWSEIEEFHRR